MSGKDEKALSFPRKSRQVGGPSEHPVQCWDMTKAADRRIVYRHMPGLLRIVRGQPLPKAGVDQFHAPIRIQLGVAASARISDWYASWNAASVRARRFASSASIAPASEPRSSSFVFSCSHCLYSSPHTNSICLVFSSMSITQSKQGLAKSYGTVNRSGMTGRQTVVDATAMRATMVLLGQCIGLLDATAITNLCDEFTPGSPCPR
jgi:hypothetical protein